MSIVRATRAIRSAVSTTPTRNLAIMPTVKKASDTSTTDFPALSHVSLTSTAADLARQLTDFYSNPDSTIKLDEEMKKAMHAEISKRVQAIPESQLPKSWAEANIFVPDEIRLGDNPYFETFKKLREKSKHA